MSSLRFSWFSMVFHGFSMVSWWSLVVSECQNLSVQDIGRHFLPFLTGKKGKQAMSGLEELRWLTHSSLSPSSSCDLWVCGVFLWQLFRAEDDHVFHV